MNDSRLARVLDRLQHSGRVRNQLIGLTAFILAFGHVGSILQEFGISERAARVLWFVLFFGAIAFWFYRAQRVNLGNIFTLQYHGWYRVAKLLERDRDLNTVVVRLYSEQYSDRPKRLKKSAILEEDEAGNAPVIAISDKEFESCEPVVIFDEELSDADRELLEKLPPTSRVATLHY